MKRAEIEILARQNYLPWVGRLPETRACLMTVIRASGAGTGCSLPAGWTFTAGPESAASGGVYCFSHLVMILSRGEEQVRIEDHVKQLGTV
jgi:hypothetical protein